MQLDQVFKVPSVDFHTGRSRLGHWWTTSWWLTAASQSVSSRCIAWVQQSVINILLQFYYCITLLQKIIKLIQDQQSCSENKNEVIFWISVCTVNFESERVYSFMTSRKCWQNLTPTLPVRIPGDWKCRNGEWRTQGRVILLRMKR